jgi:hypothetical protein
VRNLFDQYTHPENRLTHALVSSIAQDQYLLREFIKWTTGQTIAKKETIQQRRAGRPAPQKQRTDAPAPTLTRAETRNSSHKTAQKRLPLLKNSPLKKYSQA